MADDLVLNVKQISQYPTQLEAALNDLFLMQRGGVGGPYLSIAPANVVSSALMQGGWLRLAPSNGIAWNGASLTWENGLFAFSEPLAAPSIEAGEVFSQGALVATVPWVEQLATTFVNNSVWSFNGRRGEVMLMPEDILRAGGIAANNPRFSGLVIVPTPWDFRNDTEQAANCRWVQGVIAALLCSGSVVTSINGRGGDVVLNATDITIAASMPGQYARASNAPLGDSSTRIATTFFVDETAQYIVTTLRDEIKNAANQQLVGYAPLDSPAFTGVPTGPTASPGSTTGQLATTAFVQAAVTAATTGVSSFNTRTGAVTLTSADVTAAGGALLVSPALSGTPTSTTAAPGDNSTKIATTAFVHAAIAAISAGVTTFNGRAGAVTLTTADVTGAGGAPLASAALTGVPTAPTAAPATNTTQLATTAFVQAALTAIGTGVTSFNARTGAVNLQANDISAAGGALLASPTFTGTPSGPTAVAGTSTNQLATTAFVQGALTSSGVASFNGRSGVVSLQSSDISSAGGALLASPAFSGTPTAPNPAPGTNNTQVATTSFVMSAVGGSVVSTFNGRSGAVTLSSADITGAGGAVLASPAFSGVPTAPTAAANTSSTQLATTAFVMNALGSGGVVNSFNGRSGAITLQAADVSAAGGALLAGPAFSGVPTAPTATTGTGSNQLATCQFVLNELGTLGGVTTFNGRAGNITLTAADVTSAGGALIAGPAFTGAPTAPTAAPGTSSTQLATCAFVAAAIAGNPTLTQSDTAPTVAGNALWFDSIGGQLYVQYVDPSTSAKSWVIANSPQAIAQPAPVGSRVLLSSTNVVTSAPVASINVFRTFDNTYDIYEIEIYDLQVSAEQPLLMRVSTDGSTFDATSAGYWNSGVVSLSYPTVNNGAFIATSFTAMYLMSSSVSPTAAVIFHGRVRFSMPWVTDRNKPFEMKGQSYSGNSGYCTYNGGSYYTNSMLPLKGFQIIPAGGNITRAVVNLYGIVKAGAGGT